MLSRFGHVQLFGTPWIVARQDPLSTGFSRQEYWSGLPCPPPGDLPDPGIELVSPVAPALQADSLPLSHRGAPEQWWEVPFSHGLWSHLSNLGTKVPSWGSLPPQRSPAPTSGPQSGQGGPLWPPPGIAGHRGGAGPLPYRPAPANPRTSLAGSAPMG